jgi:hypothetical protein
MNQQVNLQSIMRTPEKHIRPFTVVGIRFQCFRYNQSLEQRTTGRTRQGGLLKERLDTDNPLDLAGKAR